MNNDLFKEFIKPHFQDVVIMLGGITVLREQYNMMPAIHPFLAGFVCGFAICRGSLQAAPWREPADRALGQFTQEETRRVFDYIRLQLETESATS
jgi:hypothetical protein